MDCFNLLLQYSAEKIGLTEVREILSQKLVARQELKKRNPRKCFLEVSDEFPVDNLLLYMVRQRNGRL